jgi:hypothetical protein
VRMERFVILINCTVHCISHCHTAVSCDILYIVQYVMGTGGYVWCGYSGLYIDILDSKLNIKITHCSIM